MKNKVYKKYKYSIVLTNENLDKLVKFLEKYYNDIVFYINTINWDEIELNYNELLKYDNYEHEKIIWIKILWLKVKKKEINEINELREYSFLNDNAIEINIWDTSNYYRIDSYSVTYEIKSVISKEFNELKEWLYKIFNYDFKANYSFTNNFIFSNFINLLLFSIPIFFLYYYGNINLNDINKELQFPYSFFISLYFMAWVFIFNFTSYNKIYHFFFPKYIFWIWKQKYEIDKKIEYRKNLIWTITISWIILPIIINFLSK